jgi:2-C-methyl-D-erythritol 4-phosphate cytidylyltransferase
LPYALIHGESLIACASWALGDAGVTAVDYATTWTGIRAAGEPFVFHDVLCPMAPASFIGACVARAVASDAVVVAFRPVTDTVKVLADRPADGPADGFVGETVDRASVKAVASPIVLPASVVAALAECPSYDFVELVEALSGRFTIEYVEAPTEARRISSEAELRVLELLTVG